MKSNKKYPMNLKQIILSCSIHFLAGFFLEKQWDKLGPIARNIASPWCADINTNGSSGGGTDVTAATRSTAPRLRQVDIKAIAGEISKELSGKIMAVGPPPTPAAAPPPRPPTVPSSSLPTDKLKRIANNTGIIGDEEAATNSIAATEFHRIVHTAYQFAKGEAKRRETKHFDINTWLNSGLTTTGGLDNNDRILLAQIYSEADSVFEYGLGESTYLANYLNVPRYAGIDSDPVWVDMARNKVSPHYRFYFGDIGKTAAWGFPYDPSLTKNMLNYQLGPLVVEQEPFDVYVADGRYRLPCLLASFLHASARGANTTQTTVLIHDCSKVKGSGSGDVTSAVDRDVYKRADHLLELVNHSDSSRLCVYRRKPETTDSQLSDLWLQYARHDAR